MIANLPLCTCCRSSQKQNWSSERVFPAKHKLLRGRRWKKQREKIFAVRICKWHGVQKWSHTHRQTEIRNRRNTLAVNVVKCAWIPRLSTVRVMMTTTTTLMTNEDRYWPAGGRWAAPAETTQSTRSRRRAHAPARSPADRKELEPPADHVTRRWRHACRVSKPEIR